MSQEEILKIQKCVLKVNMCCDGCVHKLKKTLQKIDGVFTTAIDLEQRKVVVSGNVDPNVLIKKLENSGKLAELWVAPKSNNNQNQVTNQPENMQNDNGGESGENNHNKARNQNQEGGGNNQPIGGDDQQMPNPEQQQQQFQQQLQPPQKVVKSEDDGSCGRNGGGDGKKSVGGGGSVPISSFPPLSAQKWTYDVFLSFRGEDTRCGFTGYLRVALRKKGFRTFIDKNLQRGEEIARALREAIEESSIAVVILSVNYASSTFCLEELVKILECREQKGQSVLPIFYKVDPSDLRDLGKSFGDAFAKHEAKFKNEEEKVQKWKSALREVANLSGLHFKEGVEIENKLVKKVVREVSKIKRINPDVTKYPNELNPKVQQVFSLLRLILEKLLGSILLLWILQSILKNFTSRFGT